ncbi:MAG TPA: insulinase family protein [Candidatus Fimivivens faecavium]|nr:insulinase family protein [Candidatus Fimivivens faecavium]
MTNQLFRNAIGDGISFSVLRDPKFKHNRLSVHLIAPLDPKTVTGYAIVPFLLRKGCKSRPDFTRLNAELDSLYGASLTAGVSKIGANQVLTLSISAIDDRFALGGEPLVQRCAELLRDLLTEPLIENGAFPERDLDLERQYLIDTIEAEINDKRSYAVAKCRQAMDEGDPAALRKYGTIEDAKKITAKSAAGSYRELMERAAVEIVFCGSGDASPASAVFRKAFAGARRQAVKFAKSRVKPAPEAARETVERMEVAQSKLVLGFRTGEKKDAREAAAARLMCALYGGTPSSKLFMNVREKLSLCYYCAARFERASGVLMVDSGVEEKNIGKARQEILVQLGEIQNGNFEEETLLNTKLQLINSLRTVGDSLSALEDWYLFRIVTGEMYTPVEDAELLSSITAEEVIQAANKTGLDTVYLLTSKQ